MSLRGRLALFTAASVSLAVAACAVAGWFAARGEMIRQVDATLARAWAPEAHLSPAPGDRYRTVADWCGKGSEPPWMVRDPAPTVLLPDGRSCPQAGPRAIRPTAADLAVTAPGPAGGSTGRSAGGPARSLARDGRLVDGEAVRVRVVAVPLTVDGRHTVAAVALAQPLRPVDDALAGLALLMAGVAGAVIAASGAGALWIARRALQPVDRLTRAVEDIARTRRPGATVALPGGDEIARLGRSFDVMSTALADARESQARLIADAGHELRTPLTSLRTNVDLLVRSEETGRALPDGLRSRMLGGMRAQMAELTALIGDLLELAGPAEAPGPGSRSAVVALHEVVARALDAVRQRGPEPEFGARLTPWYVRGDARALERAVLNLLDNAVKFGSPGGPVEVVLAEGVLTVRERGCGITPEELPHVFDAFWRAPSARPLPGSGLGLAIAARAVREAGGELALASARSERGGPTGTTATVRLPGTPTGP
ncbi:sensor histidine kinase [Kitasatospora camelliae]|uniref:sensor histidine kinase n=1 Tax=Kitasatospora camelliae TaxID=3156397 RepID=UPI00339C1996